MTGKFSKNFISLQKSILEVLNNKFWVVICVPKHTPHIPRHILSLFEGEGFRPKDLKNTFSDRRWPKCLLSWQICMTFEAQDSFMHAWQPRLFFYQKWAQKSKSENMRYILDLSCTIDSRWLYFSHVPCQILSKWAKNRLWGRVPLILPVTWPITKILNKAKFIPWWLLNNLFFKLDIS